MGLFNKQNAEFEIPEKLEDQIKALRNKIEESKKMTKLMESLLELMEATFERVK